MAETQQLPIEIYTESTPNPASLKFVVNKNLLPQMLIDCKTADDADDSPIAQMLFQLPFVTSVFISNNFITISKREEEDWFEITPEIKEHIKTYLKEGKDIVTKAFIDGKLKEKEAQKFSGEGTIEDKIQELLDKYVKPAIEMDGGHIAFKSFNEGLVTLELQGACSGCPSSSITLKSGIEGLLKRMVPEVTEVVAEEA